MPNAWIVVAVIERFGGKRRQDMSEPTSYTRARREIERLGHAGVKAMMKEAPAVVEAPRPRTEAPAREPDERQESFPFAKRSEP